MTDDTACQALLREIRDNQRQQIALQMQALDVQREHVALAARRMERAERLQDRAEALQSRYGGVQKLVIWLLVPMLLVVFAMIVWPYLRYYL